MTSTRSVEDVVDAADGWHLFGIVVSIYNLTVGHGDSTLWTALLSSSLGYLLPVPHQDKISTSPNPTDRRAVVTPRGRRAARSRTVVTLGDSFT